LLVYTLESIVPEEMLMIQSSMRQTLALSVVVLLLGCAANEPPPRPHNDAKGLSVATFAGGCFWCVEADFEKVPGVVAATSGYTGGHTRAPSYDDVSSGTTGHREAVEVRYDPDIISYEGLLQAFWRIVDPTDPGGQFGDRGAEYTTAIWYHTDEQRRAAERSKVQLDASGRYRRPIVTPILPAARFYEAEDRHQDYYRNHAMSYEFYRYLSGRDDYLERTWGRDLKVDYGKLTGGRSSS
jgi:peptide methionine sulfoxide reductase msrA/msrB